MIQPIDLSVFTRPHSGVESISGTSVYLSICLSVHLSVITSYLTDISALVAQIKKNKKKQGAFFSNFASGRTPPTQSTGSQPIQLVPKHCFLQISQYRSLKSKNSKNKVHFFSNFASGRTLPTQSTGPQPIQLVPKHRFLQIFQQRSL